MTLPQLEKKRQEIHKVFNKADTALKDGTISHYEHQKLLIAMFGTASEQEAIRNVHGKMHEIRTGKHDDFVHQTTLVVSSFFVLMLSFFTVMFFSTGGITGAVTIEMNDLFTVNDTVNVTIDGVTKITANGVAQGVGDIVLTMRVNGESYVLYEYHVGGPVVTGHAFLEKSRFAVGETITFSASHVESAYLMTAEEAVPLGNATNITNLTAGTYTIKLIINDTNLSQEELPFTVVAPNTPVEPELFSSCGEACTVNLTGDAVLEITVVGASLSLDTVVLTRGNSPPFAAAIEDVTAEELVVLNLHDVFVDPDGDELFFSTSNHGIEEIVDGILTITGPPGTYPYIVYASDLQELVESAFVVTLTGTNEQIVANTTNATNSTGNESTVNDTVSPNTTVNETISQNVTVNETGNTTQLNESINITLPVNVTGNQSNSTLPPAVVATCDHPDINKRPIECLQLESAKYFQEQEIFITNAGRDHVARITPIGNLLLRGTYYEYDTFAAPATDYVVAYEDEYGNDVKTVWFDTATGNVHLTGRLYEEQTEADPVAGNFVLKNKKGIVLAWADVGAGDLYIRGNVIPYRRSLE
ncbi:MAG: hypothetical protein OXR66_00335 [Candidatus Woesearchaeota archaeon]|nr:hypothetical protein [Candidatus Woesearchaeota archaeon]